MPTRDIVEQNKKLFPPGGSAAKAEGCTCSAADNCDGAGYQGRKSTWMISVSCPLHYCDHESFKTKRKKATEE